jgi:nicotinamidase-related amidase
MDRLERGTAHVLIVDIQERLASAMDPDRLARMVQRTTALLVGARALGVPVTVTEQYPRGLGPTIGALTPALDGAPRVEKITFAACGPEVDARLAGRSQILIAGMETHICVYQTVRGLVERGFRPVLLADAVLSRSDVDHEIGLTLCHQAGALVMTVESALFDMLGQAGTPEFKAISAAVR